MGFVIDKLWLAQKYNNKIKNKKHRLSSGQSVPQSHTPPGHTIITQVRTEIPQQNKLVPSWNNFQHCR